MQKVQHPSSRDKGKYLFEQYKYYYYKILITLKNIPSKNKLESTGYRTSRYAAKNEAYAPASIRNT